MSLGSAILKPRSLRTAEQIRETYFAGTPITARWILEHCPRVQLSPSKVLFDEDVVSAWLASRVVTPEG